MGVRELFGGGCKMHHTVLRNAESSAWLLCRLQEEDCVTRSCVIYYIYMWCSATVILLACQSPDHKFVLLTPDFLAWRAWPRRKLSIYGLPISTTSRLTGSLTCCPSKPNCRFIHGSSKMFLAIVVVSKPWDMKQGWNSYISTFSHINCFQLLIGTF